MNMDSSMHQSFINLIYPSKSKKLMSNEAGGANGSQTSKESKSGVIVAGDTGHHQKSKSLYVGSSASHIV
jgi:hypothetical protein